MITNEKQWGVCLACVATQSSPEPVVGIPANEQEAHGPDVETLLRRIAEGNEQDRQVAFDALQTFLDGASSFDNPMHGRDDCALENENFILSYAQLRMLMDCLENDDDIGVQFAVLMLFANVTSGSKEQSQAVVTSGAILPFIQFIDAPHVAIAEQAVLCVGNIACEDAFTRKLLYDNGGLHAVLRFLKREELSTEQLGSGAWAFANMCRSRALIFREDLMKSIDIIEKLLHSDDVQVVRCACSATAYLMDGPCDRIQRFLDRGIAPHIIKLTRHAQPSVTFSALRAISNFLSGSDAQIEEMIELDVVHCLAHVLKRHRDRRIIKQACMAMSNVAAGSQSDILKIIETGAVHDILEAARHGSTEVRIEATWALGNAIVGSGHTLIKEFLGPQSMKVLSAALTTRNPALVKLGLQAIRNFLWCGDFAEDPSFDLSGWDAENDEDFWEHAQWLSDAHGFYRLSKLRMHPDQEIARTAFKLLDTLVEDPYVELSEEETTSDEETDDESLNTNTTPTTFQAH